MMSYIKWIEWIMLCEYAVYGHLPNRNIHTVSRRERIGHMTIFQKFET